MLIDFMLAIPEFVIEITNLLLLPSLFLIGPFFGLNLVLLPLGLIFIICHDLYYMQTDVKGFWKVPLLPFTKLWLTPIGISLVALVVAFVGNVTVPYSANSSMIRNFTLPIAILLLSNIVIHIILIIKDEGKRLKAVTFGILHYLFMCSLWLFGNFLVSHTSL